MPKKTISEMPSNEKDIFLAKLETDILDIANKLKETDRIEKITKRTPCISNEESIAVPRYNIVLIGRTGAGKSALVNYIFGQEVRASAIGLPVTKRGFHRENVEIGGVPSTIFDSWGLETANADIWLNDLNEELSRRSVAQPITMWFHTVIYCLQAGSHRIEPFELAILQKLRSEQYRVIVALTKSDAVSEKATIELTKVIQSEIGSDLNCVPICSVEEETRIGMTERFGFKELFVEIRKGFWESIMDRVPSRCVLVMSKYIEKERDDIISYAYSETGLFNHSKIAHELDKRIKAFSSALIQPDGILDKAVYQEIVNALNLYKKFAELIDHSLLTYHYNIKNIYTENNIELFSNAASVATVITIAFHSYATTTTISSIITALSGLSLGALSIGGPIAIGVGIIAAKIIFLEKIKDEIRKHFNELQEVVMQSETEIRKHIASVPDKLSKM